MPPATPSRALPVLAVLLCCGCGDSFLLGPGALYEPVDLDEPWRSAAPEDLGFDTRLLEEAIEEAEEIPRVTSVLVARRGRLVLERYYLERSAESFHDVRDVTGVVVSSLVGVALERGDLGHLDTPVAGLLAPERTLTGVQREITVEHLLTMTSGFEWDEREGDSYIRWIFSEDPVEHLLTRDHEGDPGTVFAINSAAVHLLGEALEGEVGRSLPTYARTHLLEPAGIDSVRWERAPGFTNLGSGLELRSRDLLRLGQLLLQNGRSGTRRVVSAEWVKRATRSQVPWTGADFGPLEDLSFGYLWWADRGPLHDAFFAWGYGGQFVYVVPRLDLVVVTTTEWRGLFREPVVLQILETAVLDFLVNGIVAAVR